jgi:hypothetical protein
MGRIFLIILGGCLMSAICMADGQQPVNDSKFRESYSLGYEIGANVKRQEMDVDLEVLLSAVREGVEGKKPALTFEEIRDGLK